MKIDKASVALASSFFSLKAGLFAAIGLYASLAGVTSIGSFSSGSLTRSNITDKARDLSAPLAFVVIAVLAFIALSELLRWLSRRTSGAAMESALRSMLLSNIPVALSLGGLILSSGYGLRLILFSLACELLVVACVVLYAFRSKPAGDVDQPRHLFEWIPILLLFGMMAGAAVASTLASLNILMHGTWSGAWFYAADHAARLLGGGVAGVVAIGLFMSGSARLTQRGSFIAFVFAQLVLILGVLRFVGPIFEIDGRLQYRAIPSTPFLVALAAAAIASGTLLILNARRRLARGGPLDWAATPLLATLPVVVVALLLKLSFDTPALNLMDDYHTGEFALPYWSWRNFGLLPYVDINLARGWTNLLTGFVAEEGFGGGYAVYPFTAPISTLAVYALLYLSVRYAVGPWVGLLVLVVAPIAAEIDIVMTAILALIAAAALVLPPARWLVLWVLLGTVAVLFAPGQGGLLVAATGPLGIARFVSAIRYDRRALAYCVAAVVAVVAALTAFSPFASLVVGAVRYALEQSAANIEANGIAWAQQPGAPVWELLRSSWLLVTVGIAMATYQGLRAAGRDWSSSRYFILGIPIVLLGSLFIFKAGVRIDPGSWTRLGVASVWFATLLLPLFVFFARRGTGAVGVLCMAAFAGAVGPQVAVVPSLAPRPVPTIASATMTDGSAIGLPHLGRGPYDASQVQNYATLKAFADTVLDPGEGFLDLTSRNSLAYVLGRRPINSSAVYNLSDVPQQLREIVRLEEMKPRLALADSRSSHNDGGPLSWRANALYRYVIETYRPVEDNGAIWLKRRHPAEANAPLSDEELTLFTRAFFAPALDTLSAAWGDAWSRLQDQIADLSAPLGIHPSTPATTVPGLTGSFAIVRLADATVKGESLGLVVFGLQCHSQTGPARIQVYWTNERFPEFSEEASVLLTVPGSQRLIVPLDTAPKWVFGGKAQALAIKLQNPEVCQKWTINDVRIGQRAYLEEVRRTSDAKRGT